MTVQLYTGAIDWDASSSPARWGPKVKVDFKMQEGGTRAIPVRNRALPLQNFPKVLRISKQPFAVGGTRLAHYAKDLETYREAARLAVLFNKRCKGANIGAKVHHGPVLMDVIAKASPGEEILEEISGATSEDDAEPTVLLLEDYLEGKFIKWNNDRGHVWRKDDAIPQAFSHFSFLQTANKASTSAKVVVDIQGVVDARQDLVSAHRSSKSLRVERRRLWESQPWRAQHCAIP
ncbi:g3361 [Coccomyxa elongata]